MIYDKLAICCRVREAGFRFSIYLFEIKCAIFIRTVNNILKGDNFFTCGKNTDFNNLIVVANSNSALLMIDTVSTENVGHIFSGLKFAY